MFGGLGMPIPYLSNKPGPGRPGWSAGSYDFQFKVNQGQVAIKAIPRASGSKFTIKWQDGTEQPITSAQTNLQSPTTDAGIISINKEEGDTTWCDEFAVVSGKNLVTEVVSWGQNPWNKLQDAFKDCTNLTDISKTSLITDTTGNLISLFSGCTGLTEAIIKSWDLSQSARLSNLFNNCTNLEKVDWTGLSIKLTAESPKILYAAGSTTTNGCEFLMSNVDWSTSTSVRLGSAGQGCFQNSKIKANSNFSGWTFPSGSAYPQFISLFQNASIPASNATIDISNWNFAGNTYATANLQNAFHSFNSAAGSASTGLKINMSNWNFGDANWTMESMFNNFKGDQIIGLSTWTVGSGSIYNMKNWAQNTRNLKIPSNDNISNSFASSINITTGTQYAFQNMSANITNESDWGVFPNLSGANFSSNGYLQAMFGGTRFTTPPSLDNVTFHPGGGYNSYESFMNGMKLSGSQGVDFTNVTMKPSQFNAAFQQADIAFLKFGSGVDFSEVGRIENFALQATLPDETLEFATNLSFGSLTNTSSFPAQKMSTCQTDNFIRRLHATQPTDAGVSSGTIYFDQSAVTESPSVVRGLADELVNTGGWSFNGLNATDATLPFVYPSYLFDSNLVQSVTPTTVPTGGQFSTTSSGVNVNSSTGEVTWSAGAFAAATIRCTYTDGCYNEVKMFIVDTVPNSYSMKFDGASNTSFYFENTDIALGEPWTMSFWFKRNGTPSSRERFIYGGTGGWFSLQEVNTNGQLLMRNINGNFWYWTNTNICDNQWHHIVLQRQPYTPANNYLVMRSYVDGVLDRTSEINDWRYKGGLYNEPVQYIGGGDNPAYTGFNGHMDEFAVWNSTLTQEEITLIYQAQGTNKVANLSSLPTQPDVWFRLGD